MRKIILLLLTLLVAPVVKSDIVIVNNPTIPQTCLYRYELQSIFMLNTNYWRNGVPITPVFINFDNPIHNTFISQVLHVSPYNYNLILKDKIQLGDSKHFIIVNTIAEAIEKVRQINGAIAYITFADYINYEKDVRVITIID